MSVQVERVRWRALVDTVRLRSRCYRVVSPSDRLSRASLHETWQGFDMEVDQKAAMHLAMAWGLASRSRHTLVYLPLRRPAVPPRSEPQQSSTWSCCTTARRSRQPSVSTSVGG